MDGQDQINRQLFCSKRSRPLQFRLLWLVLVMGIAPAVIWISYLSAPQVVEGAHEFVPSHLSNSPQSERDLVTDSIGAVTLLSLLTGVGAFVLMWAYGDHRIAVITVVSAAFTLGGISLLLLLVNGSGMATVANAHSDDVFVVYAIPVSLALAIGAAMGSGVANRR